MKHACFLVSLGAAVALVPTGVASALQGGGRPDTPATSSRPTTRSGPRPAGKATAAPSTTRAAPLTGGTVVDLGSGVWLEMVSLPAGSFEIGDNAYENERPVHRVTITKPYMMGKYEVTQAQWKSVMETNPSEFTGNDQLPVEQVSWDDCQVFIRKLNAKTGLQFRLPTEAEWEYAGRAGTTGDYPGVLDQMAWYDANSGTTTYPVGRKQPNAWGLYDMHGNVCEWCQDWYGNYPTGSCTDPQGPSSGSFRVFRGGSMNFPAAGCRSAGRGHMSPGASAANLGLRLVTTVR